MDNVEVFAMTLNDLEQIKDSLAENFDDFWNYNVFKSELENPNSKYIVAKIGNIIVGFTGFLKAVDDVHITNIVTAKKYRKHGIGTKLLENLINLAKQEENITSITLEVNSNNIAAINLYEKFGFNVVGFRKKYYNNQYDAILMTKDLKGEYTDEKKGIKL